MRGLGGRHKRFDEIGDRAALVLRRDKGAQLRMGVGKGVAVKMLEHFEVVEVVANREGFVSAEVEFL